MSNKSDDRQSPKQEDFVR